MEKRRRLTAMGLALALSVLFGLAVAPPAGAAPALYNPIANIGNGLCLQPQGGSTGEVPVVQMPCNGSFAQGWKYVSIQNSSRIHLVNQLSQTCMNAFGPTVNGTPVIMIQCVTVSNEEWLPDKRLPEVVQLQSRAGNTNTNLCLDVPGAQPTVGLALQIWRCNGSVAQHFTVGL
jgi:hypothetical protein